MDAVIPIAVRRGSLSAWQTENPVLRYGEIGLVHGGGVGSSPTLFVIGNGVADFNNLYSSNSQHFVPLNVLLQNYLNPAIATLEAALLFESNARTAQDASLQLALTNEATARSNGDNTLQANIDNEASTRALEDSNLAAAVEALNTALADLSANIPNWFGLATQAGDLIVFDSSTGTMGVIQRGTDGQYLVSDSGENKGLRWNTLSVEWADVSGKPTEFPPESHTHTKAEISDSGEAWTDRRAGNYYRASGMWYYASENATQHTAVNHSQTSVFLVPFVVQKQISIQQLAIEVTTAGAAGSVGRLGLYAGDPSTCLATGLPLYDSGSIAMNTTGVKTVTPASALVLPAGLYFFAFSHNSASAFQLRSLSANAFPSVIGKTTAGGSLQGSYINGVRGAFGALPDASTLTQTRTQGSIYAPEYRIS